MKKLGYFNQPMWAGPSQGMRNLYPGITAPPRARTTTLKEETEEKEIVTAEDIFNQAMGKQ